MSDIDAHRGPRLNYLQGPISEELSVWIDSCFDGEWSILDARSTNHAKLAKARLRVVQRMAQTAVTQEQFECLAINAEALAECRSEALANKRQKAAIKAREKREKRAHQRFAQGRLYRRNGKGRYLTLAEFRG